MRPRFSSLEVADLFRQSIDAIIADYAGGASPAFSCHDNSL